LIWFLDDQADAQGEARARCNMNQEIRSDDLRGGFAAEVFMRQAAAVSEIVRTYKRMIQTFLPVLSEAGRLDGKCIQDALG